MSKGKFKARAWQEDAVSQIRTMARAGADRALVFACPGAGKTYGGLLIADDLARRAGKGPKIIVLTPNLAIKSQWIERAKTIGLHLLPVNSGDDLRQEGLPLEEAGFIMSYQQAVILKHSLRQFCEANKPIVILDEVHHTEGPRADRDGNSWGHAVEYACAPASFKLCTTGTPFREGNNPISFVGYDDNQTAVAAVKYNYAMAIRDGVCRPIEFGLFEGTMVWVDKGERIEASFSDKLTKKRAAQRLRAAISTDGDHPRTLLAAAHQKLEEIRAGASEADRRAAGIVVAEDIAHAEAIADELQAITGEEPLVVHNKVDDAQAVIDQFRSGDAMWIVGVSMLSEGVDIPRLRVGAYLSNIRAALYFNQFCGRLSRVMDSRTERSFVFMPADSELEAIALSIEEARAHALGEEYTGHIRRIGNAGRPRKELEVIGSDGVEEFIVVGGMKIARVFMDTVRDMLNAFRLKDASRANMTDAEALKILIDVGVVKMPEA